MSEIEPGGQRRASDAIDRRRFLLLVPLGTLAGAAATGLTGCRRETARTPASQTTTTPPASAGSPPAVPDAAAPIPAWPETSIPLASLPEGQRTVVRLGTFPVEVQRTGRTVQARSLLCTHMGCPVQWRVADARYFCPCHGGLFDADGRPLEGPPPRPLDTVPVTINGETAVFAGKSGSR